MAYTPVPTDITQPVDSVLASTAAAEFRALKAYIQTIVSGGGPGAQTPGMIADFAFVTAPPGWLLADGALVSRVTYAALWALVQSNGALVAEAAWASNNYGSYSTGDGTTTFRLPDFRAMTRKAADGGRAYSTVTVGKFVPPASLHQHRLPLGYDGSVIYGWMDGSSSPIFGSEVVAGGPPLRGITPWSAVGSAAARVGYSESSNGGNISPPVADWNTVASNIVITCIKT